MSTQKESVIRIVEEQKQQGRRVGEILATLGIKRVTYYRWKKGSGRISSSRGAFTLSPEEQKRIEEVKETHPEYRHRRIQGVLQSQGFYLSPSTVYEHLKKRGQVEPNARREAPWKKPRYEIRQKNLLWGCDWT